MMRLDRWIGQSVGRALAVVVIGVVALCALLAAASFVLPPPPWIR
jgi:hypothetical protein